MNTLAHPFELRVLDGEQRGASVVVEPGVPLSVSGQWHSDVVLRSPGAAQAEVELQLAGDAVELQVRQGDVRVGGEPQAAGARVRVPLYAPILIGDTAVALGVMGSSAWNPLFGRDTTAPAAASASAVPLWTAWLQRARAHASPRRLLVGGAVVSAASMALLTMATLAAPKAPSAEERAQRAQALLHAAGFKTMQVHVGDDGQLVAAGYLDSQAQRSAAERVLQAEGLVLQGAPSINEHLASAVEDIYRVNGVVAQVQAIGPGVVRVVTQSADVALLQRAQDTARRDVAGLVRLEAQNNPPPRVPSPVPLIDDPGKRIASIVGGQPPHVVTADGARYFIGALLPTGHRIQAIDAGSVQLEREGEVSVLRF